MSAKHSAIGKTDEGKLADKPQLLLLYIMVLMLILSFAAFFFKDNADFLLATFGLLGKAISYYFSD